MRERTPSADDTPTRAPPTPPKEAASTNVVGSKAVNGAAEVFFPKPISTEKMVASAHNLEELGMSHPASASNERQQHEKHGHPYKTAQTAQDKRSRLSNVINNLRKKVPETTIETQKEEDDRNSVERNLETLQKYVMTVLDGVIKDEEENKIVNIDRDKGMVNKSVDDIDGKAVTVDEKPDDLINSVSSLELLKTSVDMMEGAVSLPEGVENKVDREADKASDNLGRRIDGTTSKRDGQSDKNPEVGVTDDSRVIADESRVAKGRENIVVEKTDVDFHKDIANFEKIVNSVSIVESLLAEADEEESEGTFETGSSCNMEAEGRETEGTSRGIKNIESSVERVENKAPRKSPRKLNRSKADQVEATQSVGNTKDASSGKKERLAFSPGIGDRLSDCQQAEADVKIDEESTEPRCNENREEENADVERVELVTICRELLNDLLNDIDRLIDENSVVVEDTTGDDSLESVPEDSQANSEPSEPSTTSLHCSLPLDKVASILQNCQTSVDQTPPQKSSSKPPSPIVRHLCLYCDRKFLSISLRQRHTERVHQIGGGRRSERNSRKPSQNCQYCSVKCGNSLQGLFQHMVGSHADKYHACVQCTTRYATRDALVNHMSDSHGAMSEGTRQTEKYKVGSSSKEAQSSREKTESGNLNEIRPENDQDCRRGRESTPPKQMLKDAFSNPGSPEFDSSFYSSVSCNIRENLLHHLDGKLQPSLASTSLETKPSFYEHSANQIQFPIDISLTAATPVYSKEYSTEDFENSSEYAQKPGKTRTHPRRVSFEKYNFPRKYDGKEQWSCSIKDLSKFDISTQLSLRKKQQLIKERMTLNRLSLIPILSPTKLENPGNSIGATQQQLSLADLGLGQTIEAASDRGVDAANGQLIGSTTIPCKSVRCIVEKSKDSDANEKPTVPSEKRRSDIASPKCSAHNSESSCSKSTEFSSEFASFMRVKKWDENGADGSKSLDVVYAELTGEWSRPRIYICGACAVRHVTLKEMEEHKALAHPNVWCSHLEFSGDQRELYKHLFVPGRDVATLNARNDAQPDLICTKCSKGCNSLADLHRHMLECGGDQTWLLGLFGNGKKKCKWRPFGSRSRRRRQRGMKRNIQNSQTPRANATKERPPSGPRVRPSDRESIQKMLANLPPKRASRKVLQDTMTRSQGTLRNVQTRSRPRLAVETSSVTLSRNKAALKNKLLKNAKSFQRNRHRNDNLSAVIESVVSNNSPENVGDKKVVESAAETVKSVESTAKPVGFGNRPKLVRGISVLSKKKNVKTKDSTIVNIEHPRIRGKPILGRTVKTKFAPKSVQEAKPSLVGDKNSSVSLSDVSVRIPPKVGKNAIAKSVDKSTDNKSIANESAVAETKLHTPPKSNTFSKSGNTLSRKKKLFDPVASLNASLKAKSQARTEDGKFTRGPSKNLNIEKVLMKPITRQVVKTRSATLLARPKIKAVKNVKKKPNSPKRITRLSSDSSDNMPTLEPAVSAQNESVETDIEKSGNDIPILSPVTSKGDIKKKNLDARNKTPADIDLDDLLEKSVIDVAEIRSKVSQQVLQKEQPGKKNKGRRKRKGIVSTAPGQKTGTSEEKPDEKITASIEIQQTKKGRQRNRKSVASKKNASPAVTIGDNSPSVSDVSSSQERDIDRSNGSELLQNNGFYSTNNVREAKSSGKTKQDRTPNEKISHVKFTERPELDESSESSDLSTELSKVSQPAEEEEDGEEDDEELSTTFGLKLREKKYKRNCKRTVRKGKEIVTRARRQRDPVVVNDEVLDTDLDQSSDEKVQKSKDKLAGQRKSARNIAKRTVIEKGDEDVETKAPNDDLALEEPAKESSPSETSQSKDQKEHKVSDEIEDSESVSLDTFQQLAEESNQSTDHMIQMESMREEDKSSHLKSPKRSNGLGKRRGRIKAKQIESSNETVATCEEDASSRTDDRLDTDGTSSKDLVPTDLVNLSLGHLQQESGNSNVDSGKENSSETPVNVPKLKVVRPKKSKGLRRDRVNKRTLSNVIGILTEGVNIPLEIQQSVVLTVQTSVESGNPESLAQDSGQQVNENDIVASEVMNLDRGDKLHENSDPGFGTSERNEEANVDSCEKVDKDQAVLSKVTTSGTVDELVVGIKNTETPDEEPTNDIILDLSRRKPKGKGSFLEKIVSKIAKQKDALLEGDVGSLLDHAAEELTNILDEVIPNLTESTESLNAVEGKIDTESKTDLDKMNVEASVNEKSVLKIHDESESIEDDNIDPMYEKSDELNGKDITGPTLTENILTSASDQTPIDCLQCKDTSTTESMDITTDDPRDGETTPSKSKRKSKKRSFETNSPKKNKRKSVEAEAPVDEDEDAEELCLADIMKLIQKPKEDDKYLLERRENMDGSEDNEAKIEPGKRKTSDEDTEHILMKKKVNGSTNSTVQNNADYKISESETVGTVEKPKRKSIKKKSLADEHLLLLDESNLVAQDNGNSELEDAVINEKTVEPIDRSNTPTKRIGKRKPLPDDDDGFPGDEEITTNLDSIKRRTSKRKSLVNESSELADKTPSRRQTMQNKEDENCLVTDAMETTPTTRRKSSKRKSLATDQMELPCDDELRTEQNNGSVNSYRELENMRTQETTETFHFSLRTPKGRSLTGEHLDYLHEIRDTSPELNSEPPMRNATQTTEIFRTPVGIQPVQTNRRKTSKRKSLASDNLEIPDCDEEILKGSKRKSLVDEHLNLPVDIDCQKLTTESVVDSYQVPQTIEPIRSTSRTYPKRKSLTVDNSELGDDDDDDDDGKASTDDITEDETSDNFNNQEGNEIRRAAKRRSAKKKSLVDEHLELPDDEDEPSQNQSSRRNRNTRILAADRLTGDDEQISTSSEAEQDLVDRTKNLIVPSFDKPTSTKRKSSKRKSRDEHLEHINDALLQNMVDAKSVQSPRRRSTKRKAFADPLKIPSDLELPDELRVRAQVSAIDSATKGIDNNGSLEKKQTPARNSMKKKSLVDEHLELPDEDEILADSEPSESDADKNGENNNESPEETQCKEEIRETEETQCKEEACESEETQCKEEICEVMLAEIKTEDSVVEQPEESTGESANTSSKIEKNTDTSVDVDGQSKEGVQGPKKRASGNFAVAHTKSGEILIVEKRKKLTKETAKFFCEVCDTSFTRKSSLKKHSSAQSHRIQVAKSGKDDDTEMKMNISAGESTEDLSEIKEENDSNGTSDNLNEEQTVEPEDSEENIDIKDELIEAESKNNASTSLESKRTNSIPVEPPKCSVTPLISEEVALEDELLDEEVCNITENMTHDEYVLTDHISPDVPEAALVKVPSKKPPQKPKKKNEKAKSKKINLAEEHLDLDTPEPTEKIDALTDAINDRPKLYTPVEKSPPSKASNELLNSSHKKASSEHLSITTPEPKDLSKKPLDTATPIKTSHDPLCLDLRVPEQTSNKQVNFDTLFPTKNTNKNYVNETYEAETPTSRRSSRAKRTQPKANNEEFDKTRKKTKRDTSATSELLDLETDPLNLNVLTGDQLHFGQTSPPNKKQSRRRISRQPPSTVNSDRLIHLNTSNHSRTDEQYDLGTATKLSDLLSNLNTSASDKIDKPSNTSTPIRSFTSGIGDERMNVDILGYDTLRDNPMRNLSPVDIKTTNDDSSSGRRLADAAKVPTSRISDQKARSILSPDVENQASSTSSLAERPLSELLSKSANVSNEILTKAPVAQLTLDFSNIAEKLKAPGTLMTDTNRSIATEFDSDENSMDTSMSVDIQKLLDDPEFTEDSKLADSQMQSDNELQSADDISRTDRNRDDSLTFDNDNFAKKNIPETDMIGTNTTNFENTGIDKSPSSKYKYNAIASVEKNDVDDLEKIKTKSFESNDSSPQISNNKKGTRNKSANKENARKSRSVKAKNRRKLVKTIPRNESSESGNSDNEDTTESQNKNKIVKCVFGRVFAGDKVEKIDKVREVLDDWDSRSEDGSQERDGESVESSRENSEVRNDSWKTSSQLFPSSGPKRNSMQNNKRNQSPAKKNNKQDGSVLPDNQNRNNLANRQTKKRNSSTTLKRPDDADIMTESSTPSRCRQSKKRAEERISKAFEEDSLTPFDNHSQHDLKPTSRSRENSYELRNQSKHVPSLSEDDRSFIVHSKDIDYDAPDNEEPTDHLEMSEQLSDLETESSAKHPESRKSHGRSSLTLGSKKSRKETTTGNWNNFAVESKQAKSKCNKTIKKTVDYSDNESSSTKHYIAIENTLEMKPRDFTIDVEASNSPAQSSIALSSVRNRSPTPDRNSQSSQESDDDGDIARGRISPMFVCNSPDSTVDSTSNNSNDTDVPVLPRKRSSSEFSGDKVIIRSPLSNHGERPEMVVTIAPTDAIEDNALDVPQEVVPQKSRQGKVLNFDEELFVECCSRLKATTENELRGAKKIKLDHSDAFHRRDEQGGYRTTRDRWRDVESQNSLGSLLESVNQLLGEEMYSNTEKDYSKHMRNLRSENSSRSGSPDADISRPDNLGYEDSLDVAFEHNNKLRDKIQQRMRESENLIASTFGQRNNSFDNEQKHNNCDQNRYNYETSRIAQEDTNISNSNGDSLDERNVSNSLHVQQLPGKVIGLDPHGFKSKMSSALGGLLDKAISNLLHNNGKHDHNGSTPMKVLAELACARAPTSTTLEIADEKVQTKATFADKEAFPESIPPKTMKDSSTRKIRNPIKELFERKKEINDRKHGEKSKAEAALKELNNQRQRRMKKNRRRQEFPLVRKSQHGGMVERKKRRDGLDKKEESASEKIKDIYDFEDEESQIEPSFNAVMPYRSKAEKSFEISCLRTKVVDVAEIMSKAIDKSLENGKESDKLGRRLESMIDQKFKEIEKSAPKTKGALKAFQSEDKQEVTGPMDDFIERKQRSKRNLESGKHQKSKRKSKILKKKSRNAWYENDSSDEFRTAAKTEDIGVGISKSQRTCSKGKQNLFAEMSTSSESEFEHGDLQFVSKRSKKPMHKPVEGLGKRDIQNHNSKEFCNYLDQNVGKIEDLEHNDANEFPTKRRNAETKKSESEISDHPLVIDERRESDEQRNSDEDAEPENNYGQTFELDDLYREDSSDTESEAEVIAQQVQKECIPDNSTTADRIPPLDKTVSILESKYLEEDELIPLEDALDLLDRSEDLCNIPSKVPEILPTNPQLEKPIELSTGFSTEISDPSEKIQESDIQAEILVNAQDDDSVELPEKLLTNEKPPKESENLPLHVFLSRKVQESKKRKQQQLKKLQEEQERILMDLQPTRRQRKCAIGKQGLLAEISSSDEEFYVKEICKKVNEKSDSERPRKQKRESREKKKERYIEKKHEQMFAKEQKAIEEEILRELEKKKGKDSVDSENDSLPTQSAEKTIDNNTDQNQKRAVKTNQRKKSKQKQKKPSENVPDNIDDGTGKATNDTVNNCDETDWKLANETNFDEVDNTEATSKQKKLTKTNQKSKKPLRSDGKPTNRSRKRQNSNGDSSKNRSVSENSRNAKDRRSSSGKHDAADEELRTTKCWNKVEEGVGVAIGRRKRAAANQLYYWSSSSDEEEVIEPPPVVEEEEDDRQEQHGWIVGDSHKRMITMLAMEKQLKEKRRRSEDEFEPNKSKNKKHRNSTS